MAGFNYQDMQAKYGDVPEWWALDQYNKPIDEARARAESENVGQMTSTFGGNSSMDKFYQEKGNPIQGYYTEPSQFNSGWGYDQYKKDVEQLGDMPWETLPEEAQRYLESLRTKDRHQVEGFSIADYGAPIMLAAATAGVGAVLGAAAGTAGGGAAGAGTGGAAGAGAGAGAGLGAEMGSIASLAGAEAGLTGGAIGGFGGTATGASVGAGAGAGVGAGIGAGVSDMGAVGAEIAAGGGGLTGLEATGAAVGGGGAIAPGAGSTTAAGGATGGGGAVGGGTMAGEGIFTAENLVTYGPSIYGAIVGADDDAEKAAAAAANLQAKYQTESLNYMKEREAIPQQFRDESLRKLGGLYGLEGGEGDQNAMIERAMASPLYKSMIGGREAGEEAILRNASATGGLRSGDVQANLYDYNTQLENRALLESYNQQVGGLTGMASLPSNAASIANMTTGIGTTLASGMTAEAQAEQVRRQQTVQNIQGLGGLAIESGMFSDRRLKKDIQPIGIIDGHKWYKWAWNTVANKMGLEGETVGVMADEVYKVQPEAVSIKNLFMFVDYPALEAI